MGIVNWKVYFCFQPQLASLCATSFSGRPASSHKQEPPLKHEDISELHSQPQLQDVPQPGDASVTPAACNPVRDDGSRSSTDSPSLGSVGETGKDKNTLLGCWQEGPPITELGPRFLATARLSYVLMYRQYINKNWIELKIEPVFVHGNVLGTDLVVPGVWINSGV